jgi:hypothetical protein
MAMRTGKLPPLPPLAIHGDNESSKNVFPSPELANMEMKSSKNVLDRKRRLSDAATS